MQPHIFVAIPALDELATLPLTLDSFSKQQCKYDFSIHICVNQPEKWWNIPEKQIICENNSKLIDFLSDYDKLKVDVIDKSSRGNGWDDKDYGVGMARKVLFDRILEKADDNDILVSFDADTVAGSAYLNSLGERFHADGNLNAVAVPYFHKLTDNDSANRAILRYEIYMRNFLINMFKIGSPYAFTALGSAITVRIKALRKIGGITPVKSGEDFYLMQKLRKMTYVSGWLAEPVFPAARFSERVPFGTGPAMLKGCAGDWESYPVYHHKFFSETLDNYKLIPHLFEKDIDTEFISFLKKQFNDDDLWTPLRKNSKSVERFTRAFHEKADGLRILQFLKNRQKTEKITDEVALKDNYHFFFGFVPNFIANLQNIENLTTGQLNDIRNSLYDLEMNLRFENYKNNEKQ